MSPTSCQTAPPRARRVKDYSDPREEVSTICDPLHDFVTPSVGRRSAETDHARPFRGFGLNPARKLLRRAGDDVEALLPKELTNLGRAHPTRRLRRNPIDYIPRHAGRRAE